MFSSYVERLFYICILISCIRATASEDFKDEGLDRGAHSDRQGVWFGPRLGKRSQITNDDNRNTFWRLLEAADALRYYYDQMPYDMQAEQQSLARVAAGPDKRTFDNAEFTPRLGRRRAPDNLPMTTAEGDMYRPDPVMSNPMSNFFSPRLGRTIQFSPRLGRELNYDLYPDKIRVARSANITKAN